MLGKFSTADQTLTGGLPAGALLLSPIPGPSLGCYALSFVSFFPLFLPCVSVFVFVLLILFILRQILINPHRP